MCIKEKYMENKDKKIEIPSVGMTLSRDLMPQLDDPSSFLKHLKDKFDIQCLVKTLDTKNLKSTQSEFDDLKIKQIMFSKKPKNPILVSTDGHVLDGHHRWIADHNTTGKTKAYVIDHPVLELRKKAQDFSSLSEEITHKEFGPMLDSFMSFASDKLGIKSMPNLRYKGEDDAFTSFGGYNPSEKSIVIHTKNRHPMDIYRTIAHELVHHKQNEDGELKDVSKDGKTGSPIENFANSKAGEILRHFAKGNPDCFKLTGLVESTALFVIGVPCSGKDALVRQLKEEHDYQEINIQSLHKTDITSENLIISAVAHEYDSIAKARNLLDHNGFVTEMVFVDVPNEISKLRNEQRHSRGQRVISESIRFKKYTQAQENYSKFEDLFKGRITKVMNDDLKEACWKGYTQPKKNPLKPDKENPGQFVPNCVPKKKVDEDFEMFVENTPSDREEGTNAVREIYSSCTPGQEGYGKKKTFRRKKLNQEQKLDSPLTGFIPPDGIGPEYSIAKSPSLMSGIAGVVNESVFTWATNETTITRFTTKYGSLAEQKLIEAALNLDRISHNTIKIPRSIQSIREAWYASDRDMGTVANSSSKDEIEEGAEKENDPRYMYVKRLGKHYKKPHSDNMVVHDNKLLGKVSGPDSNGKWTSYHKKSEEKGAPRVAKGGHKSRQAAIDHILQSVKNNIQEESERDSRLVQAGVEGFNKPKRTPGHPKKSHVVVAKDGDSVKTIRFGEQGAETAGAPKEGESDRMKKKRASFKARHRRNINKGKMSAAYWADKVKW